ncbi:hypothetical protein [Mucilaginibacter sp. UR6-11]|uniref:hypothetical protein n=1 Tax=Mucilaginibacter sp. UR6-11 TaxID=1435644 RepID=UPI001E5B49CA|nr:hypothetical protein [Mucilaginibacter sp. UR6-11]MCC8426580.1 hypothetical protein [Mucilaginibacter sp. UR6-11]
MDLKIVNERRLSGDLKRAAELAEIPYADAKKAIARKKSKYHDKLCHFLGAIIKGREDLRKA